MCTFSMSFGSAITLYINTYEGSETLRVEHKTVIEKTKQPHNQRNNNSLDTEIWD